MRIRSSLKGALILGTLTYVAVAGAQPTGGAGGPGAPGAPGPGANQPGPGGAPAGDIPFQAKTQLTPQEQLNEGRGHLVRMEATRGGVRKMLEEARGRRDVVKTLCLNDKLSQVDVANRSGRERYQQLTIAVKRNDTELSNHEFTILTVLRQRTEQLAAESNQCVGEEGSFVGDTRVTSKVDRGIAPEEAYYPGTDATLVTPTPLCESCDL